MTNSLQEKLIIEGNNEHRIDLRDAHKRIVNSPKIIDLEKKTCIEPIIKLSKRDLREIINGESGLFLRMKHIQNMTRRSALAKLHRKECREKGVPYMSNCGD